MWTIFGRSVSAHRSRAVLRARNLLTAAKHPWLSHIPSRCCHLLVSTKISPETTVTGLTVLKLSANCIPHSYMSVEFFPLFTADTILPIQAKSSKNKKMAINTVLRRYTTKHMNPRAINDKRDLSRASEVTVMWLTVTKTSGHQFGPYGPCNVLYSIVSQI